jgi:hypothetical protein
MVGKVTVRFAGVMALVCASGLATVGCSRKSPSGDDVGSVAVALTLPGGAVINTVNYTISRNGGLEQIMGTIDVSAPGTTQATALVSGLLPTTYSLTMTATSSIGQMCSGSAPFTVVSGQTALVEVILQCKGGAPPNGAVALDGRFDQCPVLTSISATKLQVPVGNTITVAADASDPDPGDVLTYLWSASAAIGTFGSTTTATTTFTCNVPGATTLGVSVFDGTCGDALADAIPITCTSAASSAAPGSCVETNPPPELAGTCMSCLSATANPASDGCCPLAMTDPIGFMLCQAASACLRAGSGCVLDGVTDVNTCYCGTHPGTCTQEGQPNGPCVAQITAAAARNVTTLTTDSPTPDSVTKRFGDARFAVSRAVNIQNDATQSCFAQCGYFPGAAGTGGSAGTGGMAGTGGAGGGGGAGGTAGSIGLGGFPGTCLETDPPASLAAGCEACILSKYVPQTDGCCPLFNTDPTGYMLCQAASDCMRSGTVPISSQNPNGHCNSGGDVTSCYCGTNASTCDEVGGPNGPCIAPITAAAAYNLATKTTDAPNQTEVIMRQGDINYALGRAANVNGVAGLECPVQCGL